jgi:DNA-binding NtrC family response regulator
VLLCGRNLPRTFHGPSGPTEPLRVGRPVARLPFSEPAAHLPAPSISTRTSDRTIDPELDRLPDHADPLDGWVALAEIAFHSDLSRVGDQLVVPSAPLIVGRESPRFQGPHAAEALADPCISREQFRIFFQENTKQFQVIAAESSRRPLQFFDESGAPLSPEAAAHGVPPGTYLAVGDRALLLLDHRPRRGALRDESLGLRGDGTAIRELRTRIRAVAVGNDPALVLGETGTGKELVARAIHEASERRGGRFVAVNCAALPDALVESELFGHVRGAFSGAVAPAPGVFRSADGGSLFLDEVAELSPTAQAKLLRALETGTVRPVGGTSELPIDVRIIAATHRDLNAAVHAGTFRADLFARLDGPGVRVPPLRLHRADLPALFTYFLSQRRSADPAVDALFRAADVRPPTLPMAVILGLLGHTWPRNVRELARYVAKVAAAARESAPGSLRPVPLSIDPGTAPGDSEARVSVAPETSGERAREGARDRPSREELELLLQDHDYVAHRVARALGVPRTTLDRWLRHSQILRPADLDRAAVESALLATGGNIERAADALRISARGLRLRLGELGLAEP